MEKEQLKKLVSEQLKKISKKRAEVWISHFKDGDYKKYLQDLPDTPDNILLILKGHLLVEQEINRLLEAKLPNPEALKLRKDYGPRFIHKVSLLKALIPKPKDVPNIWDILKNLNDLRNDFSHKLSCNDVDITIDKFVENAIKALIPKRSYPLLKQKLLKKSQRDLIQISFFFIISYLAYFRRFQ